MQTCSTITRPGAAFMLVTASIVGPAGGAAAVPIHEPIDGVDDGGIPPHLGPP